MPRHESRQSVQALLTAALMPIGIREGLARGGVERRLRRRQGRRNRRVRIGWTFCHHRLPKWSSALSSALLTVLGHSFGRGGHLVQQVQQKQRQPPHLHPIPIGLEETGWPKMNKKREERGRSDCHGRTGEGTRRRKGLPSQRRRGEAGLRFRDGPAGQLAGGRVTFHVSVRGRRTHLEERLESCCDRFLLRGEGVHQPCHKPGG